MSLNSGRLKGFAARDLVVFLAKFVVTVVLLRFIYSQHSPEKIQEVLQHPRWPWLAAALAVYGVSVFLGALQWSWILRVSGISASNWAIRRLYFIGLFFNNFLPANIGGDAYKIVDLGRRENRAMGVFCSTLMDRLIGLTALTFLAVGFVAIAALMSIPLPMSALLLIPASFGLTIVLALLLSNRLGQWLAGLFQGWGWERAARQMENMALEFARFRPRVRWLNWVFLFSLLIQLLRMVTHILVAFGLGLSLTGTQMVQLMVLVPMLALSLILPITINGIGLRESVAAQLLVFSGLAAPQVVAMESVAFFVQVVFSLLGGVLLLVGTRGGGDRISEK